MQRGKKKRTTRVAVREFIACALATWFEVKQGERGEGRRGGELWAEREEEERERERECVCV